MDSIKDKLKLSNDDMIRLARIVVDLLKSDHVIAKKEVEFVKELNVKEPHLIYNKTLQEAVTVFKSHGVNGVDVLHVLEDAANCDGNISHDEALLLAALDLVQGNAGYIISIPLNDVFLGDGYVIYTGKKDDYNEVEVNVVNSFLNSFGLELVYIPRIKSKFIHNLELGGSDGEKVFLTYSKYFFPVTGDVPYRYSLTNLKTEDFLRRFFSESYCVSDRYFTPGLLFSLGRSSLVNPDKTEVQYANYLKINFKEEGESFSQLCEVIIDFAKRYYEHYQPNQEILYSGFYRAFFRFIVGGMRTKVVKVEVYRDNHCKGQPYTVCFNDSNNNKVRLLPKQLALFLLILIKSVDGGRGIEKNSTSDDLKRTYRQIYYVLTEKDEKDECTTPWDNGMSKYLSIIRGAMDTLEPEIKQNFLLGKKSDSLKFSGVMSKRVIFDGEELKESDLGKFI